MLNYVGTFILTDSSLDRHSERVLVEGVNFSEFKMNPVMFYNHHRSSGWDGDSAKLLPIGRWDNIRVDEEQLLADAFIDYSDTFASQVGEKVKNGVLNAASIGFRALAYSDADDDKVEGQRGLTITKSLLMEASIVDIPANPSAMVVSKDLRQKSESEGFDLNTEEIFFTKSYKIKGQMKSTWIDKMKSFLGLPENATEDDISKAIDDAVGIQEKMNETIEAKFAEMEGKFATVDSVNDLKTEVNESISSKADQDSVPESVKATHESLEAKVIALEEKNTELTNEILTLKGNKSKIKNTGDKNPADLTVTEKAFKSRQATQRAAYKKKEG